MIFEVGPKVFRNSHGPIYLDGPARIWRLGFVEIEYHNYCGPMFSVFGRAIYPGPLSPWWLLWSLIRDRMETPRAERNQ